MGRFVAFDDPSVEREIEAHLCHIVAAIKQRMKPKAIILRGSFGRGEGSVYWEDGRLRFLSDYEIDVATFSPLHVKCFRELSRRLTAETGISTGVRWVRPDYLRTARLGPIPRGPAPVTIQLYESRYGSKTLYGEDLNSGSPDVDPARILPESGLTLMFNRMAESLFHIASNGQSEAGDLAAYNWITKTILACAESLLVLWGSYHYSYRERGLRFAAMSGARLDFPGNTGDMLIRLVDQATRFKLRPGQNIYPDSPRDLWFRVTAIVDPIFRHLVDKILGIRFQGYEEFPERYLRHASDHARRQAFSEVWLWKIVQANRGLRAGRLPRGLLWPFNPADVVYSAVPLLFLAYGSSPKTAILGAARRQMSLLERLDSPGQSTETERDYLRRLAAANWKIFCY